MFRSVPVISSFAVAAVLGACAYAQGAQDTAQSVEITADMPTSSTNLISADMDALPVAERTGVPFASRTIDETWTEVASMTATALALFKDG